MNKDWIGNKASTFKTLGASNHTDKDRADNDYYATDPIAIDMLVKTGILVNKNIWENACGEGHLSNRLSELGFIVLNTDLVDRGYADFSYVLDFLSDIDLPVGEYDIVTNPPYKYALEWVLKSLDCIKEERYVCLFLKTTFLEGKKRYAELFTKYPPKHVFVCSQRVKCAMNGNFDKIGSSAASYSWFVWQKGYQGKPQIDWI